MYLLIAADGAVWDVNGNAIRRHLGYDGGSAELAAFAVTNLGFACLTRRGQNLRLRLRADMFSPSLFEAVVTFMVRSEARRFAIEADSWGHPVHDLFDNIDDAVAHLDALRGARPHQTPRKPFLVVDLDMERMRAPRRETLLVSYAKWRRRRGVLDRAELKKATARPLDGGSVLARIPKGDLVAPLTLPSYMRLYGAEAPSNYLGKPFHEHPFADYHSLTAEGYLGVWKDRAPRLELVESIIDAKEGGLWRIRYERLLLPWRLADGEIAVSTTSYFRSERSVTL
jgi:hypothetical protein